MLPVLIIIVLVCIILYFVYFNKFTPHKTNNLREMYAEGLDLLVSGKRVAAYKNFKEIITQDSNNVNAYLRLGQILRESGKPVKALKIHKSLLFRKKLTSYELIELHKNLALNYFELNNANKSIKESKTILDIENENEWAINHLIHLYKKENNWKEATEYLKLYFTKIGKTDNHKLALFKIQDARVNTSSGNFNEARDILDRALNIDDQIGLVYYFIGNTYSEESSIEYDKAISIEKNGLNSIADQDKYSKHIDTAKKILSKAIPMWIHFLEINSKQSWLVLPLLKDALFALDRYSEVETILLKIIERFPENTEILASLADYYSNKGDFDKALEIIDKALVKNNDSIIVKLIKFKLNVQYSKDKISINELDEIINLILKDTAYQMMNDEESNADIKWLLDNNEELD